MNDVPDIGDLHDLPMVPKPEPTPLWDEWMRCPSCNGLGKVAISMGGRTAGIKLQAYCADADCGHVSEARLLTFEQMAEDKTNGNIANQQFIGRGVFCVGYKR